MKTKASLIAAVVFAAVLPSQTVATWQVEPEFYFESRDSGQQMYYSPAFYSEYDSDTKNYREYRYDRSYGKDYYWKNYDGGIFSERTFIAKNNQLTYYTDQNDEFTDWGQQLAVAASLAGACCVVISCAVIVTQCVVRRRKRMRELKARKAMAEMEGVDMSVASDAKDDTDDPEKKGKKSTKEMREYALDKKAKDNTGLADLTEGDKEGSRREMMSDFRVQAIDDDNMSRSGTTRGKVGNNRFDLDQQAAD